MTPSPDSCLCPRGSSRKTEVRIRYAVFREVFLTKLLSLKDISTGSHWLTPVIPATWEAKIGRITVQGQPRQILLQNNQSKKD
jgi:hypothetical protein